MTIDDSPKRDKEPLHGLNIDESTENVSCMDKFLKRVKSIFLTFESEEMEAFWIYDKILRKKFILITCYIWKISHLIMSSEEQQFIKDYGLSQPGVFVRLLTLILFPITIYI